MSSKAQVELSAGIQFVSDDQLQSGLQAAEVPSSTAQAITDRTRSLRCSLLALAIQERRNERLHQERRRQAGQVIRRSNRPRGNPTPIGSW